MRRTWCMAGELHLEQQFVVAFLPHLSTHIEILYIICIYLYIHIYIYMVYVYRWVMYCDMKIEPDLSDFK